MNSRGDGNGPVDEIDERAGGPRLHAPDVPAESLAVAPAAREDRSIAPADPRGHELLDDLKARIAELDAIAWNLPGRRGELLQPPDHAWPLAEPEGLEPPA